MQVWHFMNPVILWSSSFIVFIGILVWELLTTSCDAKFFIVNYNKEKLIKNMGNMKATSSNIGVLAYFG